MRELRTGPVSGLLVRAETPPDWRSLQGVSAHQSPASNWVQLTFLSDRPLGNEPVIGPGPFEYAICALTGQRGVFIAADNSEVLSPILSHFGFNADDSSLRPVVDVDAMVSRSVKYADASSRPVKAQSQTPVAKSSPEQHQETTPESAALSKSPTEQIEKPFYQINGIWAHIDIHGSGLKSVSFFGDDIPPVIARTSHLSVFQKEFKAYRISFRIPGRFGHRWLSIGSRGEVSFWYNGPESLRFVREAFSRMTKDGFISWEDVPLRPGSTRAAATEADHFEIAEPWTDEGGF